MNIDRYGRSRGFCGCKDFSAENQLSDGENRGSAGGFSSGNERYGRRMSGAGEPTKMETELLKMKNMQAEGRSRRDSSGEVSHGKKVGEFGSGDARMRENKRATGGALSSDPLRAIQELSFVKAELELYLDTHPDCKVALDYYGQTVDALTQLMNKYQASGKPIVASGSIETKRWSWVAEPWPWQTEEEVRK